jgi:hypothetical protein
MQSVEEIEAQEAKHGQKMIEVKIRFWTNDIAEQGKVIPKHAWASGVVRIEANQAHGIVPGKPRPSVIEKVLIEHGIVLHAGRKMKKYFSEK